MTGKRKEDVDFDRYDPYFGWIGIPGNKGLIHGENNNFYFENNSSGFRDIEHGKSVDKPAIVFLGGSFAWGYSSPTEKTFVNILRHKLNRYEVFNLSGICYGTDQSLMTYKEWEKRYKGNIKQVILIVTDQDVMRNSTYEQCGRAKPKYKIMQDKLVLTGIPVPNIFDRKLQETTEAKTEKPLSLKIRIKRFLQYSRFFDAMYQRYDHLRNKQNAEASTKIFVPTKSDLMLTSRIFEELKNVVEKRGAEFVIIFIPSYREVVQQPDYNPYQLQLIELCKKLGITCFDLSQSFISAGGEGYFNDGEHWNTYGNRIGAEAIYNFLLTESSLR